MKHRVDVKVRRLQSVLDEHAIPEDFDILSLDIEGMDVAVLNDLIDSSQYRPSLVIIEASFGSDTTGLDDIGASDEIRRIYKISDRTHSNLFLTRVA